MNYEKRRKIYSVPPIPEDIEMPALEAIWLIEEWNESNNWMQ